MSEYQRTSPVEVKSLESPLTEDENIWLSKKILCAISGADKALYSATQVKILSALTNHARSLNYKNPHPTSLFPSTEDLPLGAGTVISAGLVGEDVEVEGNEVFLQLLPHWIEQAEKSSSDVESDSWQQELLGAVEVTTKSKELIKRIRLAKLRASSSLSSRVTQFSRSAHYMGSKAFLGPYLSEIVHTFFPPETIVLDLMCGSGATSGIFSREWRTYASDAQSFSTHLAMVQGGGLGADDATVIAEGVLGAARVHYELMPEYIKTQIDLENDFLSSELSPEMLDDFGRWIVSYPRINNAEAKSDEYLDALIDARKVAPGTHPYLLFSMYYANLFFGVRQAAEIDSLRYAIDQILDDSQRSWALGALICAVSSCAYSYGGHFAQPKFDGSSFERLEALAPDLVVCRGLSVAHEFFIRLTSLGAESSNIKYPVVPILGPWHEAVATADELFRGEQVCVYLDPPYTRDEYSRYYHILETLVRYDYPEVRDKASMPKRGDPGRFASAFATRNTSQIDVLIADIISACLNRGWSCLWSYSSTGVASIETVIDLVSPLTKEVEFFAVNHVYKGQGKHKSKGVREYALLLRP